MKTLLPLTLLAASLPAMAAQPDMLPVKQIGLEQARCAAVVLKKSRGKAAVAMLGPASRGFERSDKPTPTQVKCRVFA